MKNYLKLVNFEVNRFFKVYVVLIGITALSQLVGSTLIAKNYMNEANRMMYKNMMSISQFLEQYGRFSMLRIALSQWFVFPILLCIAALLIYVFFIWYRDWLGKNTFAYRLLTLPIERVTIYLAKLTTMMLLVLGLISIQVVLVAVESQMTKSIVPDTLRMDLPIQWILNNDILTVMYPASITEFIITYGIGLVFVSVTFAAILLERSYRWKGVILAGIYGAITFLLFITPILLNSFVWINYFYQVEILWMMVTIGFVIFGSAVWMANYLLKYKIKV